MRSFNTSGPCNPQLHYMLPPEPRLPGALDLVESGLYFVVHAPRQTGKTTTLAALAADITARGRQAALLFSCERARVYSDDFGAAGRAILQAITEAAEEQELPLECQPPPWPDAPPDSVLKAGLRAWARSCPRPLVLFFDEFDALRGDALLSVASQLRDGYRSRPRFAPASVALCGLRQVRDYRLAAGQDPEPTTSPFNVVDESLRMHDFTRDQVAELYAQHTADTGQPFTGEATGLAFEVTRGQPWLVNALAKEIVQKMGVTGPVTAEHVEAAKESLILARRTHIDYLSDRLFEPRVVRIMDPLLAGTTFASGDTFNDDLQYVRDLGLIAADDPVRPANPIYREVIVRAIAARVAAAVDVTPSRFLLPDGQVNIPMLMEAFADFWVDAGAPMAEHEQYRESGVSAVFNGFLQRVTNGGAKVEREYAIGTGRLDIMVTKPYGNGQTQREFFEVKVWMPKKGDPLKAALAQLDRYLETARAHSATLLIFDRRVRRLPVARRTQISHVTSPAGNEITLLRG